MSIRQIKKLSMNEHYYALMLQCFLTGYGRPCHLKTACMSLPILMYSESREKLKTANKQSRIGQTCSKGSLLFSGSLEGGKQVVEGRKRASDKAEFVLFFITNGSQKGHLSTY